MMNFMVLMTAKLSAGSLVSQLIQVYALSMQSFLWDHHLKICSLLGTVFGWWGVGEVNLCSYLTCSRLRRIQSYSRKTLTPTKYLQPVPVGEFD